jgi:hypothetical protein
MLRSPDYPGIPGKFVYECIHVLVFANNVQSGPLPPVIAGIDA